MVKNVLRKPVLIGPLECDIVKVRDMSEKATENKVYWALNINKVSSRLLGPEHNTSLPQIIGRQPRRAYTCVKLSRPHTARFYLRLSTMCHRAIKAGNVKNRSIEYRIMKPLTLRDLLHDFIIELISVNMS